MERNGSRRDFSSLGAGFVDHLFPDAFGFEDEFNEFARGAFAAGPASCVVRDLFYFRRGVSDGDGKASELHDGNVGKIVAEKSDCRGWNACFGQNFFERGDFVWLLFVNKFHAHFFHAAAKSGGFSPSNHSKPQARGLAECHTLAIMRIERFDFERRAV